MSLKTPNLSYAVVLVVAVVVSQLAASTGVRLAWSQAPAQVEITVPAPVEAEPTLSDSDDVTVRFAAIESELDRIATLLEFGRPDAAALGRVKRRLQKRLSELQQLRIAAAARLTQQRSLLAALGAPPADDQPRESEDISEQRHELQGLVAYHDSQVKRVDILTAKADLIRRSALEQDARGRAQDLVARDTSLLLPRVWLTGLAQLAPLLADASATLGRRLIEIGMTVPTERISVAVFSALVIAIILAWPARRALARYFGQDPRVETPSYLRRVVAALVDTVARGLMPVLAALFVFGAIKAMQIVTPHELRIIATALGVGAIVFVALAGARAVFAPAGAQWLFVNLADHDARAFHRRLRWFGVLLGIALFLHYAAPELRIPAEITTISDFLLRVVVALALLPLLARRFWPDSAPKTDAEHAEDDAGGWGWWRILRFAAVALVLCNPLIVAAGFKALANWLFYSLVLSAALVMALWTVHQLMREMTHGLMTSQSDHLRLVRSTLLPRAEKRQRAAFWLVTAIDTTLLVVGGLGALVIWGVAPEDLKRALDTALFGFTIGETHISLAAIAYAGLVFLAFVVGTRIIQRLLERRLLPQTGLDSGAQNAIRTGFGYFGFVVAALVATSSLGVSFENFAIIAGALSVGIGFGLQNVVNNFVSGLILLIERPIKVGDWVVVGDQEGLIKRISVRATEIVTWQRASVIIPNSELISGTVMNWTLKDRQARLDIPIGVAYGSDIARVKELLVSCAHDTPAVLRRPEPAAFFLGFGDSALSFVLHAYIPDALMSLRTRSALNSAIDAVFRANNIEIPFPQRDVHLRGPISALAPAVTESGTATAS